MLPGLRVTVYLQCLTPVLEFTIIIYLPSSSHPVSLLLLSKEEMKVAVRGTPRYLNYSSDHSERDSYCWLRRATDILAHGRLMPSSLKVPGLPGVRSFL